MHYSSNSRLRTGVFHCGLPRRIGNHYLLYGHVDTSFPFQAMVGPDWACMIFTYGLFVAGAYSTATWAIPGIGLGAVGVFVEYALLISTVCFFSCAGCSDPGIIFKELCEDDSTDSDRTMDVESNSKMRLPKKSKCMHCEVYRSLTASHCYDCDLCISDLDHHCPWTGKCIGKKNLKNFQMFLGSLGLLILYSTACLLMFVLGITLEVGEHYATKPILNASAT